MALMKKKFAKKGKFATEEYISSDDDSDTMKEGSTDVVKLYVYDMSDGIANVVTGGVVDAIYHTGVFVFDQEISYGPDGIKKSPPARERPYSDRPHKVETIGETSRSFREFKKFVGDLRKEGFKASDYDLLVHNCNIFSNTVCIFLCGVGVPRYILSAQETAARNPLAVGASTTFGGFVKKKY